jgi:hypothetical protein
VCGDAAARERYLRTGVGIILGQVRSSRLCAGYMKFVQVMRQRSGFRSDLRSAAINEQFDTRDETRVIRCQKKRSLGNFIGLPHSAHRDGGHNPCNGVCRLSIDSRGVSRTGANDI